MKLLLSLMLLLVPLGRIAAVAEIPRLSQEQRLALVGEAVIAYREHVKSAPEMRSREIAREHWGKVMEELQPLRIIDENVNIRIVLEEAEGVQRGFYIQQMISSFRPRRERMIEWRPLPNGAEVSGGELYRFSEIVEAGDRPRPRLTMPEVETTVVEVLQKRGTDLARYRSPSIRYDAEAGVWWLFYNFLVPMPGNHFGVRVNDETGETSFMPGR